MKEISIIIAQFAIVEKKIEQNIVIFAENVSGNSIIIALG